jgi:hypothetical protein
MLFIYPMWDHESERIGKQKCTPLGYWLHGLADLIGLIGLLLLLGLGVFLAYRGLSHSFHASLFWLLTIPFGVGLIGQILFLFSWSLAYRRGFEYDYEKAEASWVENGERVTYKWKPSDQTSK